MLGNVGLAQTVAFCQKENRAASQFPKSPKLGKWWVNSPRWPKKKPLHRVLGEGVSKISGQLCLYTKFFKNIYQVIGDHFGIAAFNVVPLNEMHQFAIAEQGNGWRRRWIGQ